MSEGIEGGKQDDTRTQIERAVIELLKTTDLDKITVANVVSHAHVSRSTFYRRFDSVRAVTDAMGDRILRAMEDINRWAVIDRIDERSSRKTPSAVARMTYLYENREIIQALVGPHGDPSFLERASEIIVAYWYKRFSLKLDTPVDPELYTRFMVAGHNAVVTYWLLERPEISPEDMAEFVNQMFYSAFSQASGGPRH